MLWSSQSRHRNYRTLKLKDFTEKLINAGVANPYQEALWIAAHALGIDTAGILARAEFSQDEAQRIDALISRRVKREPLQYIIGEADFYGRDFYVGDGVLIPRHDTETIIDGVKECFEHNDTFRFLDWGTGSGCIGATILLEFPNSRGVMLDVSDKALSFAHKNLKRYCLNDRADFKVSGEFDLIVSNPPYIPSGEINGLMHEVKDFEPITALDGGIDGMTFYREILALAFNNLKSGGYIILETGNFSQVEEIETFSGFQKAGRVYDTGDFPRCVILRRILS